MMRILFLTVCHGLVALFLAVGASVQGADWPPAAWTATTPPFQIAGPVYYVGGRELSAYLLADEEGLILVNVGMDENVELVQASIRELGFDPARIRYVLITQAHLDHAGGALRIAQQSGAAVLAGEADVPLLKEGGLGDYVFGDDLTYPKVPMARAVADGETIRLGSLAVEVLATPGHTPGSTSWHLSVNHDGQSKIVLIAASVSVLANARLLDNPRYPDVLTDFRRTYQRLSEIHYDYYLPDHMIFITPRDVVPAQPQADWFRSQSALTAQLEQSQRKLEAQMAAQQAERASQD